MCPAAPTGIVGVAMNTDAGADRVIRKRVGCACGYRAEGPDDARLRGLIRTHLDRNHPELSYTDEQVREWIASGAVYLPPAGSWPARLYAEGGGAQTPSVNPDAGVVEERP